MVFGVKVFGAKGTKLNLIWRASCCLFIYLFIYLFYLFWHDMVRFRWKISYIKLDVHLWDNHHIIMIYILKKYDINHIIR